ncbi:DeoR/GlpR family DNA-binding transcription regulator [Sporolactobacillus terrae]|uniref:DeoR/GlpR family DNA-binding transcription regulator n=1 Tax=Sporolactobacillus terrae TaxID=269673 RepID=UPI000490E812|nr:DeoR/GlpR family DNA-binding transcription regulator [Sporolactobacillus terrae]
MYSEERHHTIRQIIKEKGKVQVTRLAKQFKVSEVTVRRDLAEMEEQGLLKRTFGGAVSLELVTKAQPYNVKKEQHLDEKKEIAARAAQFISDGMTLFLDAGTTTDLLIPYLLEKNNLFVVTVDLQIAIKLTEAESIDVYMVGGKISNRSKSVNSVDTVLKISKFHFDLAFLGCDAFNSMTFETDSETKTQIKRAVIRSSSLRIILSDSSKFNRHSLLSFARLNEIDYVITDTKLSDLLNSLSVENKAKFILGGI